MVFILILFYVHGKHNNLIIREWGSHLSNYSCVCLYTPC